MRNKPIEQAFGLAFDRRMFIWLDQQGVRSDEGFSFQFGDRYIAEYLENGKVMEIAIEDAWIDGQSALRIDRRSISTWRSSHETLSSADRMRVANNVRRACEFQGLRTTFD